MNLSAVFIRKPVMTTLCAVSAAIFGIVAYIFLPVSDLPNVGYPVITVTTMYPGASPEIMANNVSTPLEIQMMEIQGLNLITSKNQTGSSAIVLQFALNKSTGQAEAEVQAAIQRAMGQLPSDLPSPPSFQTTNPNTQPIVQITLASDTLTLGDLYDYANNIVAQRMMMLEGVSNAAVYGSPRAICIEMDANALASRGISVTDVTTAVQNGNVFTPGGNIYGQNLQTIINPKGQLLKAADYNDLIIRYQNGAPVRIRDVATPVDGVQKQYLIKDFWNREHPARSASLVVAVTPSPGANSVAVARQVRETLEQIKSTLPASIDTYINYDRSIQIVAGINDVKTTILIAFALVVLVVLIFLGRVRETIIPAIALPMALLMTFGVMLVLGYSLDNLSLLGLVLAVGLLVDDAVVVLENTVRHLDEGKPPTVAALLGSKEISFTVFSMTLSLSAIFIPIVFMPGLMGRMFHELAITIVVAILLSGLVAITLSPMICARLLKAAPGENRFQKWFNGYFDSFKGHYKKSLEWMMRHKPLALIIWAASLAATIWLFVIIPKGFMPIGDSGMMYGVLMTREGTSPAQISQYQRKIQQIFESIPDYYQALTVSGLQNFQTTSSMVLCYGMLKPPDQRRPIADVARETNERIAAEVPGVTPLLRPYPALHIDTGATSDLQGEYAYQLSSTDPDLLYSSATKLIAKLKTMKGFSMVSSDMRMNTPVMSVDIRRDQASSLGVTAADIENTFAQAYTQGQASQIKLPLNVYWVIVELLDKQRSRLSDLRLLWVRNQQGALVPMSAVAQPKIHTGPEAINHINQITSVTIFYNLAHGFPASTGTQELLQAVNETLPPTVSGSTAGTSTQFVQTIRAMVVLLIIALFVMYVILGILYESYIHPITVLSTLPVASLGGLASMEFFGMTLDLYGFIGIFLLLGLIKKNGIMLVDFAIMRLKDGLSIEAAAVEAAIERVRPILMTTFAAVFGALPMACGFGADGASRQPTGVCIVGGLIVAQILTLFCTPVMYVYMEKFQERYLDKWAFFKRGDSEPVAGEAGAKPA